MTRRQFRVLCVLIVVLSATIALGQRQSKVYMRLVTSGRLFAREPEATEMLTPTATNTPTPSATNTSTSTATTTPTSTATDTATPTATNTSTNTPTGTATNTPTNTPTAILSVTPSLTPTIAPWQRDYSGGLVPPLSTESWKWRMNSRVTLLTDTAVLRDPDNQRAFLESAFVAPSYNYVIDWQAQISDSNTIGLDLRDSLGGALQGEVTIAPGSVRVNGQDVTPAGFNGRQWVRFRVVVRPTHGDMLLYAYYVDPVFRLLTRHVRVGESWPLEAVGAVRFRTGAAEVGAVQVRDVSVKWLAGIMVGDSIATGHADATTGYDPAPMYASNDPTHTWAWYLDRAIDPSYSATVMLQGTAGHTLNDVLRRVQRDVVDPLDGARYRRVYLMAGSNDLAGGASAALVLERLDRVLARLTGHEVIMGDVLPRDSLDAMQEQQRQIVNALLAARPVRVVSLANDPAILLPDNPSRLSDAVSNDGVHLNWSGYQVLAPRWIAAIAP